MPHPILHVLLALLLLACAACAPSVQEPVISGADRVADTTATPGAILPVQGIVHIVQVYGREALRVGEAENFRLRLAPGFAQPVEYLWDFGDGTLSVGNNVVHRYARPGRYAVAVIARNAVNADTARLAVTITSDRSSPSPSTETLISPIVALPLFEAGQIVWVTGIHATRLLAENDASTYTSAGYRAGVVSAAKAGTTQYYIIVGGYRTEDEALTARPGILRVDDRPLWLMRLTPSDERPQGARSP